MQYKPIQPKKVSPALRRYICVGGGMLFCAVLFFCVYIMLNSATPVPIADEMIGDEYSGRGGADISLSATKEAVADLDQASVYTEFSTELPELDLFYTVYQVQKGDMIGLLAEQYGVTQDSLISLNKIKNTRAIQIGQYIKIPSMSGIVYTTKKDAESIEAIAENYKISTDKIYVANALTRDTMLPAGATLFLPDAELDWVTLQEINGDLFRRPLSGSYYISDNFGTRYNPFTGVRTYHTGIDMAASQGTRVNAALGGTVSIAGWDKSGVFGYYVIINHHSGYQTLYGHMSKVSVRAGQYVEQGQKVGEVGNTGLSTGPHLHFTVKKRGALMNPATLWN